MDLASFNQEARLSVEWTQEQLTLDNRNILTELPEQTRIQQVSLVHGSPRSPIYEYLLDTQKATENFSHFETDFCFFGHTHVPTIFSLTPESIQAQLMFPLENQPFEIERRTIINPGSVGQPRDRDPRAAYSIFDPENNLWEQKRIAYDIAAVQARMLQAGLPKRHIQRLAEGW
jgi:diadenosine tetraphosphatase ApaH/serine/threonine PP2A family protein phosphatase